MARRQYIFSKTAVFLMIFVVLLAIGFDYVLNLKTPHSLYENSLLIISFLSIMLFVLMSYGLYFGLKLKDNIGKLTDHIDMKKLPDFGGGSPDISTAMEGVGGFAEGLGGFLFAILAAFVCIMIAWALILVTWFSIIFLVAMLYWIFHRALRLVLRHASSCQGNVLLSLKYSTLYTFLYTLWMYCVIVGMYYLK